MRAPLSKDATLKDFEFPPGKAGKFLQRVQAEVLKATKSHGGDIVARMEIDGTGAAPIYRLERPSGKVLVVINGVGHKLLPHDAVSERSRTWSSATMSFHEISNACLSARSDEIRELTGSGPD